MKERRLNISFKVGMIIICVALIIGIGGVIMGVVQKHRFVSRGELSIVIDALMLVVRDYAIENNGHIPESIMCLNEGGYISETPVNPMNKQKLYILGDGEEVKGNAIDFIVEWKEDGSAMTIAIVVYGVDKDILYQSDSILVLMDDTVSKYE